MRKTFIAYYSPNEEEIDQLWDNGLFVVDANVLLNLYRYSSTASNDFLSVLRLVSDRLWISHQAAKEYQANRRGVIAQQQAAYKEIRKSLDKAQASIGEQLRQFKRHPVIDCENLLGKFDRLFSEVTNQIDEYEGKHPSLWEHDWIWDTVTTLFDDKVGIPYSNEQLEKIYQEGEKRYKSKRPPGYSDANKDGNDKYGDFMGWRQILDKAKEAQQPIIFITDDRKEDWWYKFEGKTIGPRPELVEEIRTVMSCPFHMYQPDQFLKYANEYFGQDINSEVIEEVQEVTTSDRFINVEDVAIIEDLVELAPYFVAKDKELNMDYNLPSVLASTAGMCKYVLNNVPDKAYYIDKAARKLGISKKSARLALLWLEARGRIKIEKWVNENKAIIIPGDGVDNQLKADKLKYNLSQELARVRSAYESWVKNDQL